MPVKLIRPKEKYRHLPCFALPDYEDSGESFYPFIRLPEPENTYETLKKLVLTPTLFLFRVFWTFVLLPCFALVAIIGTISWNPRSLLTLSSRLPLWRRICFRIARWSGRAGLFFYGFHHLSITHYSYKDMKQQFGYTPPMEIEYDAKGQEVHPQCNIITSNHLGFADILFLLWYCDGSFVAKLAMKDVFGIGAICSAMQALYVEKGKSTTQAINTRTRSTHDLHSNVECKGCSLCSSNLVIFPEGTTTNGNNLLMFRRGIFNAGLPVQPIIIKCPWKSCNTTWESIFFWPLSYKVMTQFVNNMQVFIAPPYVPTEQEKADSLLYAYNVNVLMAQMMGLNNDGKKPSIYLMNRDVKVCYHHHAVHGTDMQQVSKWAKEKAQTDDLIQRYLDMIRNDQRYDYENDEKEEKKEKEKEGPEDKESDEIKC
eukprot:CAMPEP_0197037772 /NCGR_PEP_ID=MMETSP1384-20130603/14899_1 /TAXON_ID=29189 /ORGANISM="Ammonia sp." /LENGTH=426 /DNA_ID=CAMNT_0042468123 /DNA_START=27 /DNA_END=1307 /DNA_ORIENTATION=+